MRFLPFILATSYMLFCVKNNVERSTYIDIYPSPTTTQPFSIITPTSQPTIESLQKRIEVLELKIILLEFNQLILDELVDNLLNPKYYKREFKDKEKRVGI